MDTYIKKDLKKDIYKFAGPVFIELIVASLFGMIDMIMLGNINGGASAAISAVGITNQAVFIVLSLVQAVCVGATSIIARYIGAGRNSQIESVMKHTIIIAELMIALPLALLSLKFSEPIMAFIGANEEMVQAGGIYFKIVMAGLIFQAFNFSVVSSFRGAGDVNTPMLINIAANLINVVGNYVLIYGKFGFPELKAEGAALSTVISQFAASSAYFLYTKRERSIIQFHLRNKFHFDKNIIYNMIKIGVPASLEQIAFRVGIFFYVKIVTSLGTVTYAAHQICLNILGLTFSPGQAFGIAAAALVGKSLGEEKKDKAEHYIRECDHIGIVISIALAAVLFFLGKYIANMYVDDMNVVNKSIDVLKLVAFVQPFQCVQLIEAGGLRGAGDTKFTLIATFVGVFVIRVGIAYLFVRIMNIGLIGAWYAVFIDQFIRFVLVHLSYRSGKWKYVTIR